MFEASSDGEEDSQSRTCDEAAMIAEVSALEDADEKEQKKEPIVVDLLDDDEDDASNKPIEIDSPIQQRRRTTRQNAGSLHSSVAKFGKFTATYPE